MTNKTFQVPAGFVLFPAAARSDVLTAAGLVRHGKQSKELADRLGEAVAASWDAGIAAASAWRHIDTAPKDGTIFLIAHEPHVRLEGSRRVYEARWHESQGRFTSVNGFLHFDGASFWQPLPAAPESHVPVQPMGGA